MFSRRLTRRWKVARALAPVLLWLVLLPNQGRAAGAFAVGQVNGFSFGIATNFDAGEANDHAVDSCRKTPDAVNNPALQGDCKVIETFSNKCTAVAWDPAPNEPTVGVGWSIAGDLQTAQRQAIAKCETTVAPGRSGTCVVSRWRCDGSAQ
jgi:hypothetical protein